jgi:ABC-2 type transport system permease protein
MHPFWMVAFLILTAISFSLFGFIIGIWADGFEKLQIMSAALASRRSPSSAARSIRSDMLPPVWRTVTLFNPVVYLVSGFRWAFTGTSDVGVELSLAMTLVFLAVCLVAVWWIFKPAIG